MKVLFLFLICFVSFSSLAVAQTDIKLEIGAKLPRKYVPREIKARMATHTNQSRPFIEKKVDGIEYIIAFDEKTREIKYIKTLDEDFITENGLRVASLLTMTREQFDIIPAWEIYAPATPDGWKPLVGFDLYLPGFSEDFIGAMKDGEMRTVSIGGFVKGGN